jgi:hypothetical protein
MAMKIIRGLVAFGAFCTALAGLSQNAHAITRYANDSLEGAATDWSLYFTQSQSLAYHYPNNPSFARTGTGVNMLVSSGVAPGSMWKVFLDPHYQPRLDPQGDGTGPCSVAVYLRRAYALAPRVRITLIDYLKNTYILTKEVNVTSASYTPFGWYDSTVRCGPYLTVGIEVIGTGAGMTGALVDDVSVRWQ